MTIETKFSIDEEVYFIFNNRIIKDKIGSIKTELYSDGSGSITYTLSKYYNGYDLKFTEKENRLFNTTTDLFNSLIQTKVDGTQIEGNGVKI